MYVHWTDDGDGGGWWSGVDILWSRVVVHLDTDRKQKILTFNAFNWRLMDLILLLFIYFFVY